MARLEVEELSKDFGGVRAVDRVSFSIDEGTRLALIGPNGAGKTTLLNLLTGQLQPSGGRIVLDGKDITRSKDFERARLAIARTFQQSNLYPGLTVLENVRLAMQRKLGLRRSFRPVSSYPRLREECDKVLAEHDLAKLARTRTEDLSYGDLRHLELALALVGETSVLFLDEPTAGMTPQGTREMIGLIQRIPRSITVCIVEHDMDVVFTLADRVLVLHQGRLIAHDTPEGVKESSIVRSVYLGEDGSEVSP